MNYLICTLDDENYTEPTFHVCDTKKSAFIESMKMLEELFQEEDSKIEITNRGDVLRIDWSHKNGFFVIEDLPFEESAGDYLLVWHHAYGVNFKILAQGTYEECVKERIRIIKKIFPLGIMRNLTWKPIPVLTPVKNGKYSALSISKKFNFKYEEDNHMEAKEMIIKDLLKMQEKTAKCNGLVAGMVAQTWVIRMLGDKIREYDGEPYVINNQEESTDELTVDISKIDFDQLACEIIDQYESDRQESGRKEIVCGMKHVLEKYTEKHDREIIDEMLMTFTGWELATLVEMSKTQEYDDEF